MDPRGRTQVQARGEEKGEVSSWLPLNTTRWTRIHGPSLVVLGPGTQAS